MKYKCPKCGSNKVAIEKRPNGYGNCQNCPYTGTAVSFLDLQSCVTEEKPLTPELLLIQQVIKRIERQILRVKNQSSEFEKLEQQKLLSVDGRDSMFFYRGRISGMESAIDKLQDVIDEYAGK